MKKFVELAKGLSLNFRIVHRGGAPLVVQCHDSCEQIVLPSSGGFQILALEEYHGSSLAGHPGARKTLEILHYHIWWQKMRSIVAQFCNQCGTCALTKGSTQHAHGALQPLPVPPAQFHLYTLDFVTDLPPAQGFNCVLTIIDHLISLHVWYPVSWGKTNCQLHKLQNYCLKTLLGFWSAKRACS